MTQAPCAAGATLASFALALGYFVLELFVFKTLSLKRAAMAMSPAGAVLVCKLPSRAWQSPSAHAALLQEAVSAQLQHKQHAA